MRQIIDIKGKKVHIYMWYLPYALPCIVLAITWYVPGAVQTCRRCWRHPATTYSGLLSYMSRRTNVVLISCWKGRLHTCMPCRIHRPFTLQGLHAPSGNWASVAAGNVAFLSFECIPSKLCEVACTTCGRVVSWPLSRIAGLAPLLLLHRNHYYCRLRGCCGCHGVS